MIQQSVKHNHREAWCHMQYAGKGRAGSIVLTIWNSRDGVTPFTMFCKEYGIGLQHINWAADRYDPDYKPKKGDLIWRDLTIEEARTRAIKRYTQLEKDLEALEGLVDEAMISKYSYDVRSHIKSVIERGEQSFIDMRLKDLQAGEPQLELVKEDWLNKNLKGQFNI
jgi:hypothetical protein